MASLHSLRGRLRRIDYHARQLVKIAINHEGRRTFYVRSELFWLLRPYSPSLAVDHGGDWYFVATSDFGLSFATFGEGSYERDVMEHAIRLAGEVSGRPGLLDERTFIDIGANIGTSTVPALKSFGASKAFSFEPHPDTYRLLRCNLVANDLDALVQTSQVALSDQSGIGVMEVAEGDWGDHRIRMNGNDRDGIYRESRRRTLPITLATFDELVADLSIDLDEVGLVWMDVQGHERRVLAGATSLLERDIPVVMEYWPYGLHRTGDVEALHNLLERHYRRVVDVRASMATGCPSVLPTDDLENLLLRYTGNNYTDLVLLK